jgi:hypothetical protein
MHNTVDNAPLMIGPATQARKLELMPMKEAPQQITDTTLATSKCAILIPQSTTDLKDNNSSLAERCW